VVEHGWVANPREFLRSVDLLVCPSVDFDPFPTVLLEAASQGVPAAATPVGGIPEIVLPDQTGWLLDPADSAGSVRTLARLVSQPEVVWRAGQLARARLAAGFTLRKMVADYQALYRSLGPDE
jgi:glycosyltransferase involved in cell wall biosynthesis